MRVLLPGQTVPCAAEFAEGLAREGDTVVIAGDFNCVAAQIALDGYSEPGPGIDHIAVRGGRPSALQVWPDARRSRNGRLFSDHAPVELTL